MRVPDFRLAAKAVLGIVSAITLCLAAYWSGRLATADRLSSPTPIPSAMFNTPRLASGNPRYLLRLADLEMSEGQDAFPVLKQAAQASPLDSAVWLQLGLQAELNGDMAAATQAFLRAAQVDRRFLPRWNLASFGSLYIAPCLAGRSLKCEFMLLDIN